MLASSGESSPDVAEVIENMKRKVQRDAKIGPSNQPIPPNLRRSPRLSQTVPVGSDDSDAIQIEEPIQPLRYRGLAQTPNQLVRPPQSGQQATSGSSRRPIVIESDSDENDLGQFRTPLPAGGSSHVGMAQQTQSGPYAAAPSQQSQSQPISPANSKSPRSGHSVNDRERPSLSSAAARPQVQHYTCRIGRRDIWKLNGVVVRQETTIRNFKTIEEARCILSQDLKHYKTAVPQLSDDYRISAGLPDRWIGEITLPGTRSMLWPNGSIRARGQFVALVVMMVSSVPAPDNGNRETGYPG